MLAWLDRLAFGWIDRQREVERRKVLTLLQLRGELSGGQVMHAMGWTSASVYVRLFDMERCGLLTGRWEDRAAPYASGWSSPRRYLYRVTDPYVTARLSVVDGKSFTTTTDVVIIGHSDRGLDGSVVLVMLPKVYADLQAIGVC